jgi:hypothetical protein
MSKVANLFLVGAPKSGTTFLFDLLKKSPDIFCPENKEPAYFLVGGRHIRYRGADVRPPNLIYSKEAYCALYQEAGSEAYRVDASTHYLSSPDTAQKIKDAAPDARIVAVLREPQARSFSHYLMGIRDGYVTEDLPTALAIEDSERREPDVLWSEHYRIVRRSLYADGLRAYFDAFGPERVRVYLFEDLAKNLDWLASDLGDFLNLSLTETIAHAGEAKRNAYAAPRFPLLNRFVVHYRTSEFRKVMNVILPAAMRKKLREKFNDIRLKPAAKPKLDETSSTMLSERLGADYEEAIALAEQSGALRRA